MIKVWLDAEAGPNDLIYAVDRRRVDLIKDSECGLAIFLKVRILIVRIFV